MQSLTQYANTTNPTYDTLASGTWSVVELNVGVFCVCMPAFRRFFAHTMPRCFGTTEDDSGSIRDAARTPSQLERSGSKKPRNKKSTLPASLFNTNGSMFQSAITKTVDTRVESSKPDDDELQLVELGQAGNHGSVAESTEDGQRGAESLYKEQHSRTIPKDW